VRLLNVRNRVRWITVPGFAIRDNQVKFEAIPADSLA